METKGIKDLIDKVIGNEGPLRVPAYWLRKVLHSIIKYIDTLVNSLRAELKTNINSKLDSVICVTYKEFYEMHRNGKGKEGQCYCITDYKPTVSRHQPDVKIRPNNDIEIKIYINYSKSYFIEHFDRLEDVNSFHAVMRTYNGALGTEEFNIVYNMHDRYVNKYPDYKWVPDNEECLDTIKVSITYGDLKSLELKYKHWITEDTSSYHIYEDVNTGEEYRLLSVEWEGKLKIRLGRADGGVYEPEYLKVEDYSFRTFGFITRMIDVVRGNDFCFDAYNIRFGATSNSIHDHLINSTIVGYFTGLLPKIYILGYTSKGVFISNSDSIYLDVGYNNTLAATTIISSTNIRLTSCINGFFYNCHNIKNNNIANCNFYSCTNIQDYSSSSGTLMSSTFYFSSNISVDEVHNSFISAYGSESSPTKFGSLSHAVVDSPSGTIEVGELACISQDGVLKGASDVGTTKIIYPKTTAAAVTDESSGKTIDVIIQELQDRITALEGA